MSNENKNTISKETMRGFLEYLSTERTLVGPIDNGKAIEYREAAASDILMDDRVSYSSIKSYYFPQTELMFTFTNEDVEDNIDIPGYAIFGAKPCDLEALRVMRVVYSSGKYADPFFLRRYDANFVIGVGCINKKPECFCEELNVDQGFSDFCDIMLTDNGEDYTITHLSEKGKQALENHSGKTYEPSLPSRFSPPSGFSPSILSLDPDTDDADYFDIIDWEKITETCKGCGICTYICPTCYCFDFKDAASKGEAKRYKCWDSCMYPKFTLHASGHNPRNKRHERYRQRVLHKYKYVPKIFEGNVACTGCGRCIRSCPVGMNIREIVRKVLAI
ncbi:MAG: 4Fe-4S dicluster domain-containing protein [Oscillospiraceae bacterium]|nr:4Fe-4S dicluster domain-containing protein [Oscillospiraceae bacterium]